MEIIDINIEYTFEVRFTVDVLIEEREESEVYAKVKGCINNLYDDVELVYEEIEKGEISTKDFSRYWRTTIFESSDSFQEIISIIDKEEVIERIDYNQVEKMLEELKEESLID